jgi:hypothetical protein
MDSKYSRLKTFVNESKSDHSSTVNDRDENERSWSPYLDRLKNFFNKHDGLSNSTDDIQVLLQKGDNDPILPSLV